MKESTKNGLHTVSMITCMTAGMAASLNVFAWMIRTTSAAEIIETSSPSTSVGIGREVTEVVETEPEYIEKTFLATAYCPCWNCCGKTDGITATGVKATAGRTIAADPNVIAYGTEVIINDHTYVVEDCGGAIKGDRIDIYFDTHWEALQFGMQELTVLIPNNEGEEVQ